MPTDIQQAALDYLDVGLHILALEGKKPNGRVHGDHWSWDESFHGKPENEAEWEAVGGAFSERQGTTGIAILIPEHFYVADVDTEEAATLLRSYIGEGAHETAAAQTKNGLHLWYYAPGANRNRWLGQRSLLFKGFGGYVVAPPSLHFAADGTVDGQYRWLEPLVVGGVLQQPEDLPDGIAAQFRRDDLWTEDRQSNAPHSSFVLQPVEGEPWYRWPKVWTYVTTGLEKAIENAADGNQNNVIHWAAMTARDEGVPFEVAMERLGAAAERGNHPRNRARDTIKGAYKRR